MPFTCPIPMPPVSDKRLGSAFSLGGVTPWPPITCRGTMLIVAIEAMDVLRNLRRVGVVIRIGGRV